MNAKGQHVFPHGNGWAVRRSGASRASGVFESQRDAIRHGRELAKSQATELYVHERNGRIKERISYGRDPLPPKA